MSLVDHEGNIEYPYNKKDVFNAIIEAVNNLNGMKIQEEDDVGFHILVYAGISLFSWGENIPISIIEKSPGITQVSITSTPKTGIWFGGTFDLGKNRRNIEEIFRETSRILKEKYSQSNISLICQFCQKNIPSDAEICPYCGKNLERESRKKDRKCVKCGRVIPFDAIFCPYCKHNYED